MMLVVPRPYPGRAEEGWKRADSGPADAHDARSEGVGGGGKAPADVRDAGRVCCGFFWVGVIICEFMSHSPLCAYLPISLSVGLQGEEG